MTPQGKPKEWLSLEDIADDLEMPLRSVRKWRDEGSGPPAHRFGKRLRFRRRDYEKWLDQHREAA